jgi:hypothetical protein
MTRPETPFPRHWLYYIAVKVVVIAAGGRRRAEVPGLLVNV